MKKIMVIFASVFLIGNLAACSSNDDSSQEEAPTDNHETSDDKADKTNEDANQNDNDQSRKMKQLSFFEIEIEVEYDNDKEYEAEIEKVSDGEYKSELDDELNNKHLKGDEAFDHIYPIIEKLNVNPDSTKEEVIKEVLKAFELADNYTEFETEITFHDGTKLEYGDK